jgi:hypothetical protein
MRMGRTLGIVVGLVCTAVFAASAHAASLTTSFAGTNSNTGIAFDLHVLPESGVSVSSMDVSLDEAVGSPQKVSVWRRTGTYDGFLGSSNGWTLLDAVDVLSAGLGQPTALDLDFSLAQGVHGFMVHTEPGSAVGYGNTVSPGPVVFENGSLRLATGTGITDAFSAANTIFPRVFNGTFHYAYEVAAPTIISGPSGTTGSSVGSFAFSAPTGQTMSFQCRLFPSIEPPPAFAPCSGPGATHAFSLPAGATYTFEVRSIDADGAVSDAVSRTFAFDAGATPPPPVTPAPGASGLRAAALKKCKKKGKKKSKKARKKCRKKAAKLPS